MNLSKVMEKTNLLNLRNSANQACVLLKNMANEDRLMLLCQLSQGEKNVTELAESTNIPQPTLSQQLTILREEGLVSTRKEGKYVFYNIVSHNALELMTTLSNMFGCNTK
jgi:DNA-binding transcriptional ArsR family regulator